MLGYLAIIALVCLTTTLVALFCSVLFRKTSVSMMTSYLVIVVAFTAPVAAKIFSDTFYEGRLPWIEPATFPSPFAAAFSLPIGASSGGPEERFTGPRSPQQSVDRTPRTNWPLWTTHVAFYLMFDAALAAGMVWLFNTRWRVAG